MAIRRPRLSSEWFTGLGDVVQGTEADFFSEV